MEGLLRMLVQHRVVHETAIPDTVRHVHGVDASLNTNANVFLSDWTLNAVILCMQPSTG